VSRLLRAQWVTLLGAVTVAGVVLSFLTPQFGSVFNVFTILQTAAVDAVIGLSQMLVLAVGDMSLAVGGIASLVTVIVGNLYDVHYLAFSMVSSPAARGYRASSSRSPRAPPSLGSLTGSPVPCLTQTSHRCLST
jgi:ribose/xylose/arabinose/galactoside ABC-type transport system permease subunit